MYRLLVMLVILCTCSFVYGADITLKGVPNDISEAQVKEWVSVLIERNENQKINNLPEIVTAAATAKTNIDSFRSSNGLKLKYAVEEVER